MKPHGAGRIDPLEVNSEGRQAPLEIVIPYTEWALGLAAMERAAVLAAKLPAAIRLIAVHTVPYPMQFGCPAAIHAKLVEQLVDLASHSALTIHPQVVLARSREEGFRSVMPERSVVLLASRRRPWRTAEERLASGFAGEGHEVSLFYVE
jgi:hypothetical protein